MHPNKTALRNKTLSKRDRTFVFENLCINERHGVSFTKGTNSELLSSLKTLLNYGRLKEIGRYL